MFSKLATSSAALMGLAAMVDAQAKGFNYGALSASGAPNTQQDFENSFKQAKGLQGVEGDFTSARLYTMIQGGTQNTVISAIPAAISTNTRMLLGLWASGGQEGFNNELAALKTAIQQFGPQMAPLIDGISVGSEDLYRITPTGIMNKAGIGADPQTVANFIGQLRDAIKGTSLSSAKVGHVDTWTAWANNSNSAVIDAVDWVGMDTYPYFQPQDDNSIANAPSLFNQALQTTIGAVGGKDVWVTETSWPVSGAQSGNGVASVENAGEYWQKVACPLLGSRPTWWYTLEDAPASPSFGVVGAQGGETPLYNLSCKNVKSNSTSSMGSGSSSMGSGSSSTGSSSGSSTMGSGSGSGSGAVAGAASTTSMMTYTTTTMCPVSGASAAATGAGSAGSAAAAPSMTASVMTVTTPVVMPAATSAGSASAPKYPTGAAGAGAAAPSGFATGTNGVVAPTGAGASSPMFTGAASSVNVHNAVGVAAGLLAAAALL